MATIVTRAAKGSPLTSAELDQNQINLNTDKAELSGATFTGAITANAGVVVDNFTLDGTTLALSSGAMTISGADDLTLDFESDINIDANGGDIRLKDNGTVFGVFSSTNNDLNIRTTATDEDIVFKGSDGGSEITALTLDMSDSGTANFGSAVVLGGSLVKVGDMTLDASGDIILDADGGDWRFKDAGAEIFKISSGSGFFAIKSQATDADIKFQGNDGGSEVTALTLDMSEAGEATFNSDIKLGDGKVARFGTDQDFRIGFDGNNAVFQNVTSNSDIIFIGKDGGSDVTALTLDMSAAGAASFNSTIAATGATISGTTNDGSTLTQITQSGTGRGLAVNRNVASGTRAMVNLAQLHASGGAEAVLDIQQTTPASRAIKITPDGSVDRFSVYGTGALVTTPIAGGHAVFNEGGVDADFKVESNGNANMLFVDGGENAVGIGTNTPANYYSKSLVVSAPSEGGLTIASTATSNTNYLLFADGTSGDSAYRGQIAYSHNTDLLQLISSGTMKFKSGSSRTEALAIDASQNATFSGAITIPDKIIHAGDTNTFLSFNAADQIQLVTGGVERVAFYNTETHFNDGGTNVDFIVESDSNANALFLDAEKNVVSLGTNVINAAFVDNQYVGLQIGTPGIDNFGGHMFMSQTAPQNEYMDIIGMHDKNATSVYFTIHIVRTGDQNRSYAATVRYAYNQAFNIITLNQQNVVVDYRVTNANVLQYRITTAGPYFVNLTVMSAG